MSNKVIGVRFRAAGKIYWFSPGEHEVKRGDAVIVETSRGKEFGTVVVPPHEAEGSRAVKPIREIVRPANRIDVEQEMANREKERDAFFTCKAKIRERGLDMKLILAEYTFDNSKILFYFTADGRIDFRELVRDLAATFKTRIELRQVGVRDETKMIGGYGICGRDLCCHGYLSDFAPVSIKMAKEQNLSLNPAKISGSCGRLMCCLNNEEAVYEEINRRMPGVGDMATVPDGREGQVISVNILRETARVVLDAGDEREVLEFPAEELEFVKSGHRRRKKPKLDLMRKPDQRTAKEQAIRNAKEQAIQAAMERQQEEQAETERVAQKRYEERVEGRRDRRGRGERKGERSSEGTRERSARFGGEGRRERNDRPEGESRRRPRGHREGEPQEREAQDRPEGRERRDRRDRRGRGDRPEGRERREYPEGRQAGGEAREERPPRDGERRGRMRGRRRGGGAPGEGGAPAESGTTQA